MASASGHSHNHPHAPHHGHGHPHGHSHGPEPLLARPEPSSLAKLRFAFFFIAAFMGVEIACGFAFNSLALLSDGFHMLSDAVALGMACIAVSLSRREPTATKTFGYKRFEVLAAFANALTLVLLSLYIVSEALPRFRNPPEVKAEQVAYVAALGLLVNLFVAWWLHRGHDAHGGHSLNLQGALLHVLGDLGASFAALLAALGILRFGWAWLDPALSLLVAGIIGYGGLVLMRKSGHVLIEGTPEGTESDAVRQTMLGVDQVMDVHDLHLWSLDGRDVYLSAHVGMVPGEAGERQVMESLSRVLTEKHGVNHLTLQLGYCQRHDCLNNCDEPASPPGTGSRA